MNREILFRGKTEPDGHWVYGSLISRRVFFGWLHWINHQELVDKKNKLWSDCEARVKSETVGQYTGLKDKNGVKIFEGDIVRHISIGRKSTYIVAWDVGSGAFHYKPTKGTGGHRMFVNGSGFAPYEIIGNIHDNPELLGV